MFRTEDVEDAVGEVHSIRLRPVSFRKTSSSDGRPVDGVGQVELEHSSGSAAAVPAVEIERVADALVAAGQRRRARRSASRPLRRRCGSRRPPGRSPPRSAARGAPSFKILPWYMTTMRSQSCWASSMYWVVRIRVTPWLFSWRSRCQIRWRAWGSSPVVGSSAMMMPRLVEQGPGDEQPALHAGGELVDLAVPLGLEFDELEQLVDALFGLRRRGCRRTGRRPQVLADGQVVVQGDFLGDDPGHLP